MTLDLTIEIPPLDVLQGRYATLTPRERRVFRLLAEGHCLPAIAHMDSRATSTIDNQACAVRLKMRCHDRVILSRYAHALGLLPRCLDASLTSAERSDACLP